MTIAEAVTELLKAVAKEHKDKVSLDLVAPWNLFLCQEMNDVSIKIVVHGLRLKDDLLGFPDRFDL